VCDGAEISWVRSASTDRTLCPITTAPLRHAPTSPIAAQIVARSDSVFDSAASADDPREILIAKCETVGRTTGRDAVDGGASRGRRRSGLSGHGRRPRRPRQLNRFQPSVTSGALSCDG